MLRLQITAVFPLHPRCLTNLNVRTLYSSYKMGYHVDFKLERDVPELAGKIIFITGGNSQTLAPSGMGCILRD